MPRTSKQSSENNGNRQEQITYLKENCPEESVLYLIFRASPQILSVFRVYLDGAGDPKIECLDYPISLIMGYKLKDEEKLEGLQVTATQDQEMMGDMLAMALSKYVFGEYNQYRARWL